MKLGDKDYWQVGDKVYCQLYGKGFIKVIEKTSSRFPLCVIFNCELEEQQWFTLDGIFDAGCPVSLFHIGAITFDEQDRPIGINYDYIPDRTPKVMVTKLPHEFVEGEEVLVKDGVDYRYHRKYFVKFQHNSFYTLKGFKWKYCIPYKGNEHCEDMKTNCESGKIPDDYMFPKKELFSDVKVDDILYRLYDGKYIRGRVSKTYDNGFTFVTDTRVSFEDTLGCVWDYTCKGELQGAEHLEQVIFFEKPKHEFKPFDKVLVRDSCVDEWTINMFEYKKDSIFRCFLGTWKYCIPYEGNEHLLGTTNSPEE